MVAASLSRASCTTRLYLADRDAEALCKITSERSGIPASPRYLDVEDEDCLLERVSESDLVVGCAGPSHLHEARMARAALEAGRDYVSLCDDPEAAVALRELGPAAERKGVRILCGTGLTPGISSLLACRAAACLDEVRSVSVAWHLRLSSGLGPATLAHLLRACGGRAPIWRAGRAGRERSGSGPETVHFPPPLGWRQVSIIAHPEPISLAEALPGLMEVDFRAGFGERGLDLALQALAWLHDGLDDSWAWREALRIMTSTLAGRFGGGPLSAVMAKAEGRAKGSPAVRALAVVGDYYGLSAAMVAASLEHMRLEEMEPGFHFPEQALDRPSFFARLKAMGVRFLVGEARGDESVTGQAARHVSPRAPCACGWAGAEKG